MLKTVSVSVTPAEEERLGTFISFEKAGGCFQSAVCSYTCYARAAPVHTAVLIG